jgi:hypothetical protein
MMPGVTYHEGGWKPELPNENIAQRVTDNGDSTGVCVIYDEQGNIASSEPCEVPPPYEPGPFELLAAYPAVRRQAILTTASNLLDRAGPIWDGAAAVNALIDTITSMPEVTPQEVASKAALLPFVDALTPVAETLQPIADAVLLAALPLVEGE